MSSTENALKRKNRFVVKTKLILYQPLLNLISSINYKIKLFQIIIIGIL